MRDDLAGFARRRRRAAVAMAWDGEIGLFGIAEREVWRYAIGTAPGNGLIDPVMFGSALATQRRARFFSAARAAARRRVRRALPVAAREMTWLADSEA